MLIIRVTALTPESLLQKPGQRLADGLEAGLLSHRHARGGRTAANQFFELLDRGVRQGVMVNLQEVELAHLGPFLGEWNEEHDFLSRFSLRIYQSHRLRIGSGFTIPIIGEIIGNDVVGHNVDIHLFL